VGINPHGGDKRARLHISSSYVKNGNIFFPRLRSAELVNQLVNFGVERYDDLVDAFTMMVNQVFGTKNSLLSDQDPIAVKVNFRMFNKRLGEDWADVEDRQMLKKYHRPNSSWNRIYG
jgi:hypothetical protein